MASLPPDLEQFVRDQLAAGKYQSSAEVFSDAVRLLRELEQRREELRNELERGIAQLEAGEYIEIDSDAKRQAFFDDIEAGGRQRLSALSIDFWDNPEDDEDCNDA